MSRPKQRKVCLTRRGEKGAWRFHLIEDGKVKWVSTKTEDKVEAEKFMTAYIESGVRADTLAGADITVQQASQALVSSFVKKLKGRDSEELTFESAYEKWLAMEPGQALNSEQQLSSIKSNFDNFSNWCQANHILSFGAVTKQDATAYSSHIRSQHFAVRTVNGKLNTISRIYAKLDAILDLPNRNPFSRHIVPRMKKTRASCASHKAMEPEDLHSVVRHSITGGQDLYDLFLLGSQTGMRMKCACLFEWESVTPKFLEFTPYKTYKTGIKARVPISKPLRDMLDRRRATAGNSAHLIPAIAARYMHSFETSFF